MSYNSYFRKERYFLSNMYPINLTVKVDSQLFTYQSAESLYLSFKTKDLELRKLISKKNWSGYTTKQYFKNNKDKIRSDWPNIKLEVMRYVLRIKFLKSSLILKEKLSKIPDQDLVEMNNWGDTYFGVNPNFEGNNYLGRLLREVKYLINSESDKFNFEDNTYWLSNKDYIKNEVLSQL